MSYLLNAIEASLGLFATCSDQLRPNERGAVLQKTESSESGDNLTDAVLGDTSGPSRNTNCQ